MNDNHKSNNNSIACIASLISLLIPSSLSHPHIKSLPRIRPNGIQATLNHVFDLSVKSGVRMSLSHWCYQCFRGRLIPSMLFHLISSTELRIYLYYLKVWRNHLSLLSTSITPYLRYSRQFAFNKLYPKSVLLRK